jgi:hypothetical protein
MEDLSGVLSLHLSVLIERVGKDNIFYLMKSLLVLWSFLPNDPNTSHQGICYMINLIREKLDDFLETQHGPNNWVA